MARYPRADWRPLGRQSEPRLTRKNIVVLHTMVGSLDGTDAYFRRGGYDGVESHFGVGHDGTVYQWQDTTHQADAQSAGNDNCISIETADSGPGFPSWSGSDVPAWTSRQLDAITKLIRWLCDTHDIPKRLVPDSGDGRHGIGYHRQGVDPWRKDGKERWSSAYGKVCPGDRRIRQIKNVIIPRLTGDAMPSAKEVAEAVWRHEIPHTSPKNPKNPSWQARNFVGHLETTQDEMVTLLRQIAAQVGAPVDIDEAALAKQILAGLAEMPDQVAGLVVDSLGPEVARQVVDQVAQRLNQQEA